MQDIYIDAVTNARIINGVVTIEAGVQTDASNVENTVRLRIPLYAFQGVAQGFRQALVSFMEQGYYGEEGKKQAGNFKGVQK